jgi:hypothetical protein
MGITTFVVDEEEMGRLLAMLRLGVVKVKVKVKVGSGERELNAQPTPNICPPPPPKPKPKAAEYQNTPLLLLPQTQPPRVCAGRRRGRERCG